MAGPWDNVQLQGPPKAPEYAAPLIGLALGKEIGELPQAARDAEQYERLKQQQNAFANGVPRRPDGSIDTNAILETLFRTGGTPAAAGQVGNLINQQIASQPMPWPGDSQQPSPGQNPQPTSTRGLSTAGTDNRGRHSVSSLASETFGDVDATALPYRGGQLNAIDRISQALKVEPGQELTPQQVAQAREGFRNLQTVVGTDYAKRSPDQDQPPAQPQRTAQAPQQPNFNGLQPDTETQRLLGEANLMERTAAQYGALPQMKGRVEALLQAAKDRRAQAQIRLNLQAKNAELTGEQKNAMASGASSPLDFVTQQKGRGEVAEALGKRQGSAIEAGSSAYNTKNALDEMEDAIRSAGNNLSTGPGAESWLKAKQLAANMGIDVKGLPQAEAVTKLNAALASASAKDMTSRPSQMEFKTFVSNNPGLQTSTKGTLALISILKQGAQQRIELGNLAARNKDPGRWPEIEEQYRNSHPIISPFTGKPMGEGFKEGAPPPGGAGGATNNLAPGRYKWTPDGLQPAGG